MTTYDGTMLPSINTAFAKASGTAAVPSKDEELGDMPEWDLSDLYSDPDSKELKNDIEGIDKEAGAFQELYQGALASLAGKGGAELAASVRGYEAMSDRLGRIGSYAGLLYAADTSDPDRAKFYGDIQEKLTAITMKLLFYPLEFNRLKDRAVNASGLPPAPGSGDRRPVRWPETSPCRARCR